MKVLIVGAGIAGLSTAILCKKNGIEFDIIEKTSAPTTHGFLILLHGHALEMFDALGIKEAVLNLSHSFKKYNFYNYKGQVLAKTDFYELDKKYGESISIEREVLHHALIEKLGINNIKFGLTVSDIVENNIDDKAEVTFSNGEKDNFDLVVGADGINSSIRAQYFNSEDVISYHWYSLLFWLDKKFEIPEEVRHYIGKDKYCVLYPNGKEDCVVYLAVKSTEDHNFLDPNYFIDQFQGFNGEIKDILQTFKLNKDESKILKTPIRHVETHEWFRGNVVIIGDAEHAVSPLAGMGTTMAMQDAFVLVEELINKNSLQTALKSFAVRRMPVIDQLKKSSNRSMNLMEWLGNGKYKFISLHPILAKRIIPKEFLKLIENVLKVNI